MVYSKWARFYGERQGVNLQGVIIYLSWVVIFETMRGGLDLIKHGAKRADRGHVLSQLPNYIKPRVIAF